VTDLRAAILARCDDLERLAEAVGDETESWHQPREFIGDPREGKTRRSHIVRDEADDVIALAANADLAALIAAFGPAAVLELVAGVREICEMHDAVQPVHPKDFPICSTCGNVSWDYSENWPCSTLRAAARMLGVEASA